VPVEVLVPVKCKSEYPSQSCRCDFFACLAAGKQRQKKEQAQRKTPHRRQQHTATARVKGKGRRQLINRQKKTPTDEQTDA